METKHCTCGAEVRTKGTGVELFLKEDGKVEK
jgi:hypothetical protein